MEIGMLRASQHQPVDQFTAGSEEESIPLNSPGETLYVPMTDQHLFKNTGCVWGVLLTIHFDS